VHALDGGWDHGDVPAGRPITRIAPVAVAPVAVAYGLFAVGVARRDGELTTYAGSSVDAAAAELVAGWALIAVGLAWWSRRPGRPAGVLGVAAGFAWFAPDWLGWQAGPAGVRAVALAAIGVTAAAVAQLALGAPTGSPSSTATRLVVATTWLVTAAIGIGRALFYDPLADPDCAAWCSVNPLLVAGSRSAVQVLDDVGLALAIAVVAAVALHAARALAHASPAARRSLWPILVPATLLLGAWAARGEDPTSPAATVSFAVRASALGLLSVGLAWSLGRATRGASAVRRLARQATIDASAESLEDMLRSATGDPTLRVAFPLRDARRWIDADGAEVPTPQRRADQAITAILREGRPVASVLHHPAVLDGAALEREVGAAARMAVDNERLRAEARARLRELKASRLRIVETGDAERRALERDLHDGAQQRLVGLSMALHMARSALADGRAAAALDDADASLRQAIADLRELAHGIHPVELTEEGLGAALDILADGAPLPIRIGALPAERLPAPIETAAYALVDEAVRRAGARGRRAAIDVEVRRTESALVVAVRDPGEQSPERALAELMSVADRVGALDGRLTAVENEGGALITAELPCA
jgi:signal transduction histidine kinase